MAMLLTKEIILSQLDSTEEFPIALSEAWEWLGYTRKDNAARAFLALDFEKGVEYLSSEDAELQLGTRVESLAEGGDGIILINEDNSKRGAKSKDIYLSIDTFKAWCMSAHTAKGKAVRRYYIQVEKEWKVLKAGQVQITAEHVEAFQFDRDVFSPWALDSPTASVIFLGWKSPNLAVSTPPQQLIPAEAPQRIIPNSSEFLPDLETQKLIDRLFGMVDEMGLAANRAGLAGNKAIKEAEFLAKQLERLRESFEDQESRLARLTEALKDSEVLLVEKVKEIDNLQKALKIANSATETTAARSNGYEAVHRLHKMEISPASPSDRGLPQLQ